MRPYAALHLLCAALIVWVALPVSAQTRHVVLLFDERPTLPGLALLEAALVRTLVSSSPDPVEIYHEAMDLSRFPAKGYQTVLRDFLRGKYAGRKIDAVVAILGPALEFLLEHGDAIFPGTPIVFCGVDRREIGDRSLPPRVSGILLKRAFAPTLELALKLHPDTKRIVVVAGTSRFDTQLLEDARTEFRAYENRLAFTYLTALPLKKLLVEISRLPPQTVVLYTTLFQDGAGAAFVSHDVVGRVSAAANAPVYGFLDQYLGLGIVGGDLYSLAAHGPAAAKLVLRVFSGAPSAEPAFSEPQARKVQFDWRQLQRWGVSENRLPDGSEVRFRPVTAWEQYRLEIFLIAAALVAQVLLIAGLLLEHRRRRRAEGEAREWLSELTLMNRRATAGELSASIAHETFQPLCAMMLNAQAGLHLIADAPRNLAEIETILREIASDGQRASAVIKSLQALFKSEAPKRVPNDLNELVRQVLAPLETELKRHQISVRGHLAEELPPVLVDRIQMQQVILNLVMNAVDAMRLVTDRPRVLRIRSEAEEAGDVLLTIEDSGPGIDPENLDRIFKAFFTTKPKGMGMGLGICRSIIEAHGGRLTVARNTPHGTVFEVALPSGNARSKATSRAGRA